MYGKLFESTYTGSMVGKGADVFAVWTYIIAHTKPDGRVEVNPILTGMVLGMTPEAVTAALAFLQDIDPASRNKEHDGKRLIREAEYVYFVPSSAKYRGLTSDAERRDYERQRKAEWRSRQPKPVPKDVRDSPGIVPVLSISADADSDADTEAEEREETEHGFSRIPEPLTLTATPSPADPRPRKTRRGRNGVEPGSQDTALQNNAQARGTRLPEGYQLDAEMRAFAESLGLNAADVFVVFCDYWRSKPGIAGRKSDWLATWRNWCRREGEAHGAAAQSGMSAGIERFKRGEV